MLRMLALFRPAVAGPAGVEAHQPVSRSSHRAAVGPGAGAHLQWRSLLLLSGLEGGCIGTTPACMTARAAKRSSSLQRRRQRQQT
jgi:hypothetical protein